jgi:uncharacterized protein (TIGR02217 family)
MSFVNERIPDEVAFGFSGGPRWSTLLVPMDNGREQRNGQWRYPRHEFSAQYMNYREPEKQEILRFFHAMRGRLHCFRFRDWNDYQAADEVQAPPIGTTDAMQLVKSYAVGSLISTRLIQAPVAGTVALLKDGVPVAGTWDFETGLFTPDTEWMAGVYTASFEFDIWVRFDSDFNAFTVGNKSGGQFVATSDIELVEVRR